MRGKEGGGEQNSATDKPHSHLIQDDRYEFERPVNRTGLERERERQRETERDRERETDRDRERHRDRRQKQR